MVEKKRIHGRPRSSASPRGGRSDQPSTEKSAPLEDRTPLHLYRAVLIGKPNVGKSTLLNALTSSDFAIITEISGTTRDSINRVLRSETEAVMLSDLPGWDESIPEAVKSSDPKVFQNQKDIRHLSPAVFDGLQREIEASDIIISVSDIDNITAEDRMLFDWIRAVASPRTGKGKPVIYCANKCDTPQKALSIGDLYEIGADQVIPIAAKTKQGLTSLTQAIFQKQKELAASGIPSVNPHVFYPRCDYKLSIVGKPNAGKSSLFNIFLNKERAVVSEAPGTTRDLVEDYLTIGSHTVKLIDTGGLRRKAREKTLPENYSVQKAIHAINQSDVVILVIDAQEGLSDQDKKIAALALSKKKSLVVALNKWDLIPERWEDYYQDLLLTYPSIREFPILPISCANRRNVTKLLKTVDSLYWDRSRRITTEALNRSLKNAGDMREIAGAGGGLRIRYAMQVQNHPPVFYIYVNHLSRVKSHFRKYLYNHLENLYDLRGTPLTLRFFEHDKAKR